MRRDAAIKVSLSDKAEFDAKIVGRDPKTDVALIKLEKGRVTRGGLGAQVQQVTPELARSFGLERPCGALVADVPPNSAAASAGIQRGDVIIAFNGRQLEDIHELPRIVAN